MRGGVPNSFKQTFLRFSSSSKQPERSFSEFAENKRAENFGEETMKKFFLIAALIFLASTFAEAEVLPAKVSRFLKKNYSGWKINKFNKVEYQENASFAKGDFNGDGKTDYAVAIAKDDRLYALALIVDGNSFQAFNLSAQKSDERWLAGVGIVEKNSEVYSPESGNEPSPKPFRVKYQSVYLYDGEGHGQVFYWQNGKFLVGNDF